MDASNVWKAFIAALGTAATYLWGGWDAVFLALVVLACMAYVTGWAAAWVHGRLSSDVGRRRQGHQRRSGSAGDLPAASVQGAHQSEADQRQRVPEHVQPVEESFQLQPVGPLDCLCQQCGRT